MNPPFDPRPTTGAPDDDPHLWLEEVDGAAAIAWARTQSEATLARFGGDRFAADRDAVRAILDRPENIPWITRRAGRLYNFWRDAASPRGLWRATNMRQYTAPDPDWDVLLDLDALARDEGEDWVWGGAAVLPGTADRALVRLSRGGGDAVVLREFDLSARQFVPGGFAAPEAKGGAVWLDRDTVLLGGSFGDGMATRSGYARTVRLWRRGREPATADVIFEVPHSSLGVDAQVDREAASERVVFVERTSFIDSAIWLGDRAGARVLLEVPSDCWCDWQGDWLAIRPRGAWDTGGAIYGADTVLGVGLTAFLAGDRRLRVLFEPGERRALQGFFWCRGRLVLSLLDDLRSVFELLTPVAGGDWSRAGLTGLPDLGVVQVWPLDSERVESDGTLLANAQDPLTPSTLTLLSRPSGSGVEEHRILKQSPRAFAAPDAVVTRHEAISIDGERIPYTQVGPPELTEDAPVHLSGYGGFQIASLPYYRGTLGKLWLEEGGTTVVANIRGGGEFGTRWHDAGRREGKSRAHDDFAAVAADLVRRGVTRPARIAAEGGSNGGLLIANMLTRYPERFGALFCTIPLIDMRRYSKLLAGASWIAEYGDPDVPEDWAFIRAFSAYHAAEPGRPYPPILLATSRRDDRVHPGHARKMAIKLQSLGYRAFFYEPEAGGHGYGKDNAQLATFAALGVSFLREAIGWPVAS